MNEEKEVLKASATHIPGSMTTRFSMDVAEAALDAYAAQHILQGL